VDAEPGPVSGADSPGRMMSQRRALVLLLVTLAATPSLFRLVALLSVGLPQFTVAETSTGWDVAWALGIGGLQDLFIAGLLLIPPLIAARKGRRAGVFTLGLVFVGSHLYYLLDLLVYQSRRIRWSPTFLDFLRYPGTVADSAWSAGLGRLLAGSAVLVAVGALVAFSSGRLLPAALKVPRRAVAMLAALMVVTVAATNALPRTTHYAASNLLFRDIFRAVYDRESGWGDAADMPAQEVIARFLTPSAETFVRTDPDYPLLKNTTGFTGPTHFDVAQPDERPPHVVLLFMESFRAADIGALGAPHQPSVTPNFDAMAEEGVLYTQFYANGIQTTRAVISTLFGVPPRFTRAAVQSDDVTFPLVGIQDVFREAGYRAAFHHNGSLEFERKEEFFGAHGFQEVLGEEHIAALYPEAERTSWGVHDEWLMDDITAWLLAQEEKGEPGFLTAFTVSNHHPWQPPAGYEPPRLEVTPPGEPGDYLRTLSYSDHALGRFVARLKDSGLSERVIVLVLADTSQPLLEHDENRMLVRHLYEENVRVPLLIWAPGRIQGPLRISDVASQVDVPPTLMDIANVGGINHSVGTSLRRVVPSRWAYVANPFHLRLRGMRQGTSKYIASEAAQREALYDLVSDPGEMADLASESPAMARRFRDRVRAVGRTLDRMWDEALFAPPKEAGGS
jgi:phosphoglycerol transferase MdoB-like AlkP superfamily enzyme